jgi:hypothetical protein
MTRPHDTVIDPLGNEVKVPSTTEPGDWFAVCQTCGKVCGGTFGKVPNDSDRKYVACPVCGHAGEPHILWSCPDADEMAAWNAASDRALINDELESNECPEVPRQ